MCKLPLPANFSCLLPCQHLPSPPLPTLPVRSSVLALKFVPVFMGSAFKNRGVQLLLDGVTGEGRAAQLCFFSDNTLRLSFLKRGKQMLERAEHSCCWTAWRGAHYLSTRTNSATLMQTSCPPTCALDLDNLN